MNKNISRRKVIAGAGFATTAKWCTPIISGVILPAHAQMSVCMESDLIGDWQVTYANTGEVIILTLNADGTVIESDLDLEGSYTWSFTGGILEILFSPEPPLEPFGFIAENISRPCNNFEAIATPPAQTVNFVKL